MEEVKVSFYRIAACGYYPRGNQVSPSFGPLDDILGDLGRWARGKRLVHTKTFEPKDGGALLPVYLVDVTQVGDAWLLTLWNESHNTEGTVSAIDGRANVGSADVAETEVEEGHIPGHATYFWFLPNDGLMASVRFQHPTTGVFAMNKYMRSFVGRFTSHVVLGDPDESGERVIVGYQADKHSEPLSLMPRFKVEVFVKSGPLDYIISNSTSIRKLKKKSTLNLALRPDKSMFQKLLAGLHLVEHQTIRQEAHIQYEVEVAGLQTEEVHEIVSQWRQEDADDSDYGFMFHGDSSVHWLGKEYVRETLELDVDRNNTELVSPHSLLRELARHKIYLLGLLK